MDHLNEQLNVSEEIKQEILYEAIPINDAICQVSPTTSSQQTQTERHMNLQTEIRIENVIVQNDNKILKSENDLLKRKLELLNKQHDNPPRCSENSETNTGQSRCLDVEEMLKDSEQLKFYTGLTSSQFMCLWNFLGPSVNKLQYWNADLELPERSPSKRPGPKRKMTPKNELFLTLMRLRMGYLHEDLAYRFNIRHSQVSKIVITWIQFLYKQFSALKEIMFPERSHIRQYLPKSFKKYKDIRCIIDCTEVFVQQPRNFGKQGNCYSSYKGHTTYKFLVGISPNGSIVYLSDVYEGSISDKEIVKRSGFLDHLRPGDMVMADRGFNIEDLLMPRKCKLIIPPFLGGRNKFTPQEEAMTKDIAKHRIHVERAIERMKKFRILQKTIPLNIQPVFSQMVFLIGCLVNFQDPLVK